MIKVYSTDDCPWCVKVKRYLTSKGAEIEEINVTGNEQLRAELIEKSKQTGVPVIDIDGTIIIGFDKKAIDKAIMSGGNI